MLRQYFRGSSLLLSLVVFWLYRYSHRNVAEAFDVNAHRPAITSDTRRAALEKMSFLTTANIALVLLSPVDPSFASDGNNSHGDGDLSLAQPMGPSGDSPPSAPLEYLLPAARVGIYIYQALAIAEDLARLQQSLKVSSNENANEQKIAANDIAKLDAILLSPPSFIKNDDPNVSRGDQYGKYSLPIVSEIGVAAQKQKERKDRAIDVGFAPQFFEVGELVGERRQWNRLQKAEKKREGENEIRRAFNIYTTNLNFSQNKYQWVGSTEEKSKRIRNDKLPTTTDVIRSDLDARDLYRNQVQTIVDDARAELIYQKKESSDELQKFDATELVDILKQAQISVDKWFSFIPDRDVKSALDAVRREQA